MYIAGLRRQVGQNQIQYATYQKQSNLVKNRNIKDNVDDVSVENYYGHPCYNQLQYSE